MSAIYWWGLGGMMGASVVVGALSGVFGWDEEVVLELMARGVMGWFGVGMVWAVAPWLVMGAGFLAGVVVVVMGLLWVGEGINRRLGL
jgi:hypothetical protein